MKLWADGSPWVGSIASSFPHLDTPTVEKAQIPLRTRWHQDDELLRVQLDAILAKHAPGGGEMSFHVNGDVGLDIVLDAYEEA